MTIICMGGVLHDVHACVCVCVLYEIFTSIFLNLLCNFTVNNCIILFQVAKKPVMT